jgi:hypothetical protein
MAVAFLAVMPPDGKPTQAWHSPLAVVWRGVTADCAFKPFIRYIVTHLKWVNTPSPQVFLLKIIYYYQ